MEHPVLVKYCERYGLQTSDVKCYIRISLRDHSDITDLIWRNLIECGAPFRRGVFGDVWRDGWEFSPETEKLKRFFQEMLQPLVEKSLDEYM